MNHVIVEGPDGAGKSTLVEHLVDVMGFERHPRASDSVAGPVVDLPEWVEQATKGLFTRPPSVFDRHPLISEPIYGHFRPDRPMHPRFMNVTWYSMQQALLAPHALVIMCLPPLDVVRVNIATADQMPGVVDNIDTIYRMYVEFRLRWLGPTVVYNYVRGAEHLNNIRKLITRLVLNNDN